MIQTAYDISVIICAYTEERWDDLVAAIESVKQQTLPPKEIIVVIDHNPSLLKRAQEQLPGAVVIGNVKAKGASGARNSAAIIARSEVLAFLDDDAIAEANWIENLTVCYDNSCVIGGGGKIEPLWSGKYPSWFPSEFNWVVGCTYRGIPTENSPVRNVIGANMSVRRDILIAVGGFRESFGNDKGEGVSRSKLKWLRHHAGDEETEFCIRTTQHLLEGVWLYTPSASVKHRVPVQRTCWRYFMWRCYDEGLGKALLVSMHGTHTGLSSERNYTFKTLPQGIVYGLADAILHHDITGFARAGTILTGLAVTAVGYLVGSTYSWFTSLLSKFEVHHAY